MLCVTEGAAPACLAGFTQFAPLRRGQCLEDVRDSLRREQGNLCAYCERIIGQAQYDARLSVEHIKPQARFPHLQVSWANLLGTCIRRETCNHHKGSDSAESFLSPVDDCPPDFIELLPTTGRVFPRDGLCDRCRNRVDYTLKVLNLNHPSLVNSRRLACQGVADASSGGLEPVAYLEEVQGRESFVPMMLRAFAPAPLGTAGTGCPGCGLARPNP